MGKHTLTNTNVMVGKENFTTLNREFRRERDHGEGRLQFFFENSCVTGEDSGTIKHQEDIKNFMERGIPGIPWDSEEGTK